MADSFLLILIGVLVVTVIALGYGLFMLFRWKVAFDGKEIVAFPSDALDQLIGSLKSLNKAVRQSAEVTQGAAKQSADDHGRVFERVQALLKAVSETRAEYRTLRDDIESKNAELERHRNGYDLQILSKSIAPVLANHALVAQELARDGMSDDLRRFAELLNENYEDLFASLAVRVSYPEVGSDVRAANGIAHPPHGVPAPSEELVGQIKSVESPSYVMAYNGSDFVLREAKVTIYTESSADGDN